jgi:transcriptional regulator of acetoin/glycerol metabolism
METVVNLRDEMEIESRVEVERRREREMAEFLPLKIVERRTIVAALRLSRGCRRDAAILGISEATLYRRLKEYGQ